MSETSEPAMTAATSTGSRPDPGGSDGDEVLYVSWGGTGRAATVREALLRAGRSGNRLAYLAILDDGAFGDVEPAMLDLAGHELSWLLDAQLDLTKRQTNLDDVPVRVLVRSGDVVERVVEAAETASTCEVLIGAPDKLTEAGSVSELVTQIRRRLLVPVEVIQPEPPHQDSVDPGPVSEDGDRRRSGPEGDRRPR